MKGSNSRDANAIYIATQDYFTNLKIGDLTEEQANVFDKLMQDGGLVCNDAYDVVVLKIQDQYLKAKDDSSKESIIKGFISFLYSIINKN